MKRRLVCVCRALVPLLVLLLWACGGAPKPPERGVLESDITGWKYRRYQQVVDIEVWVPDNPAVAYTATYVRESAEKRGRIDRGDLASAFVTRYKEKRGVIRGLVLFVRRLAQDSGYTVEEDELEGVRVFTIQGTDEAWVMWATHDHVVKLGGRGITKVPEGLIEAYGDRYPSRLASGSLEAPLSEEDQGGSQKKAPDKDGDPDDLGKPAPDWDQYTPGNTATEPQKKTSNPDKASKKR